MCGLLPSCRKRSRVGRSRTSLLPVPTPVPIAPAPAPLDPAVSFGLWLFPHPAPPVETCAARSASTRLPSDPAHPQLRAMPPNPVPGHPAPQSTPLCVRPHSPRPTFCQTRQQDRPSRGRPLNSATPQPSLVRAGQRQSPARHTALAGTPRQRGRRSAGQPPLRRRRRSP